MTLRMIGSASATLMMSRAAQARPSTGRKHECSRVSLDQSEESKSRYLTEESIHEVLGVTSDDGVLLISINSFAIYDDSHALGKCALVHLGKVQRH